MALVVVGYTQAFPPAVGVGAAAIILSSVPWPWRADVYRNRGMRIRNRSARAIRAAQSELRQAQERRREQWRRTPVPSAFASVHERLFAEDREDGAKPALIELTRRAVARQLEVACELEAMRARASGEEELAYVRALEHYRAEAAEARARTNAETERALSEAIALTERLHVPSALSGQHAEICRAMRDHFVAWSSYDQAITAGQLDDALAAVDDLHAAEASMQTAQRAIDEVVFGRGFLADGS